MLPYFNIIYTDILCANITNCLISINWAVLGGSNFFFLLFTLRLKDLEVKPLLLCSRCKLSH